MKRYIALIIWIAIIIIGVIIIAETDSEALPSMSFYPLATSIGIMIYSVNRFNKATEEKKLAEQKLLDAISEPKRILNEASIYRSEGNKIHVDAEYLLSISKAKEMIIQDSAQTYPWLANLLADYENYKNQSEADFLENKKHPAIEAAKRLREISKEKRGIEVQLRLCQHQLLYYETIFPWLEDFKELDPREAYSMVTMADNDDEYEYLRHFLSPEEYSKLPRADKYQLALDRYRSRKKTNWEAGIEYERYVGYILEQRGYSVKYVGATMGLEDMGRDLIGTQSKSVMIVQCKRWAKEKTIHEKHIFQLYGSVVHWNVEHPKQKAIGVFVTTTTLSTVASKCAKYLGIECWEKFDMTNDYPVIKCHIAKPESIYHLQSISNTTVHKCPKKTEINM